MVDRRVAAADRARTPLLTLITAEALEQDYQEAAARRSGTTPRAGSHVGVVAVVATFGLMAAIAAVQTTRNADVEDASRAQILSRIAADRSALQREQSQRAELRTSNAEAETDLAALAADLGDEQTLVTALEADTGFGAVVGEGIRIRFDNLPGSDPRSEWVRDSDLAALVNGLWVAGAEAIAINGQRITGFGGIRNVGTAVQVNSQALAPPYTVIAIGDSATLPAELLESAGGGEFFNLAVQYGWDAETVTLTEVRVPGAPAELRRLRSAERLQPDAKGGEQ